MSMELIRKAYNVPAKRGMKVKYITVKGHQFYGVIVGSHDQYLRVRIIGGRTVVTFHPRDLEYLDCYGKPIPIIE